MPKLTNEEIALLIQKGYTKYYTELWDNVKDIISLLSYRFYTRYNDKCIKNGVTPEDLKQSGFIALTLAVKDYKPEKEYVFTTYINLHALNTFKATVGLLSKKQDAFQISQSLDVPIGDEDETTLAENIVDPNNHFLTSEDKIFNDELSAALKECIATLPENQKNIICKRFYENCKQKDLAPIIGVSFERIRQIENEAYRKMKTGKNLTRLKPFANEIFSRAIKGTGLNSFKNNQASSVELTVYFLERLYR